MLSFCHNNYFKRDRKTIINRFKNGLTFNNFNNKLNRLNTETTILLKEIRDKDIRRTFDPWGLYGNGMIQKHLKSRRVRIGGGIERQERPLYQKLGRYIIHIPSLTKNVLNVKYPSQVSIKSLPCRRWAAACLNASVFIFMKLSIFIRGGVLALGWKPRKIQLRDYLPWRR